MTATTDTAPAPSPKQSYGPVSRINHWVIAVLFIGALALGLTMEFAPLERESKMALMDPHKALGVAVFVFGLWRVGWRLARGFPAPAGDDPRWQHAAAVTVHYLLLAAIIAMPASGIVMSLAGGRALDIADVTLVPALGKVEWLSAAAHTMHGVAGKLAAIIVALHFAAALKHHFIDRDATLVRMVNGSATR